MKMQRRTFLKAGIGAAGAAAVSVGLGIPAAAGDAGTGPNSPEVFGRIFRLPPFAPPSPQVIEALRDIGRAGGPLDAQDDLARGPVDLIVDPALSANNRNNPTHTAGTTFVGQFVDHDVTFDASSRLAEPTNPQTVPNVRTPALDLDSVYGRGPIADSVLYDPADLAKLRVESGGLFEDLPRTPEGRAIIADPRNDENLIIAGLQVAFLRFHNRAVDDVRAAGTTEPAEVFAAARRLTTWHYHWIVLHEFLPQIVGSQLVGAILSGGRHHYLPNVGEAFMPVEFQGAAYRFGHSMVRPSYRANLAGDNGGPFFAMIFDPAQEGLPDPDDLRGGSRAPRRFIGWQTFFNFGDGEVKPNKRIDTRISTPLFSLPLGTIASGTPPTSLPQRNLLRQLTWSMPSGQAIAAEMGAPVLAAADLDELAPYGLGLERSTPLWYYVLKEAEVLADGLHLGPVGGRIVAEVLIGLLQTDPAAFLLADPGWQPTLPAAAGGSDFRMVDFLSYARVDPASRGQ